MTRVIGEAVVPFDYVFLRAAVYGHATKAHFDFPFFTRATSQVRSVWIPLGDIPLSEGPLVVFEGSTRFTELQEAARAVDVASDTSRAHATKKAELSEGFASIAERHGSRVLSANFRAGDVVVIGQHTLHGSLENRSPNRVRLSCDLRYQPVSAPRDDRYFGPEPRGVAGGGYAELNGAKPLGDPWHTR
jgi:ectoine hydroxylase-related dioxygenase (phytanoyl-CoA dioxygenase family)